MKNFINWLKESNRYKHLLYSIPIGFITNVSLIIGLASGMEFKDYLYSKKWDWVDWLLTLLGGTIGNIIKLLLIKYFIL